MTVIIAFTVECISSKKTLTLKLGKNKPLVAFRRSGIHVTSVLAK